MQPTQPTQPDPDVPAPQDRARAARVRASASLVMLVLLVVGAGVVLFLDYLFFGVVLVVLAVFAAVDLAWVLRRHARSRS